MSRRLPLLRSLVSTVAAAGSCGCVRQRLTVATRDYLNPKILAAQMNMSPEETAVLRQKILKVIQKRYLVVPDEKLKSVISYFGVPKGVIDGIIQDWRIVYHAGANGLNDKVWAPSFWLPGVNSLIRMLDLLYVA